MVGRAGQLTRQIGMVDTWSISAVTVVLLIFF